MKTRIESILLALLLLSSIITACAPLKDLISTLPPGGDEPGGDQASWKEPTTAPVFSATQPAGNNAGPLKPVCFTNIGADAATVMAWTYVPLNTTATAIPSDASTVASPGGNTSACLSLPFGTYTWCYHWELGDLNGDGYIDYSHSFNAATVILDESDTEDLDLAEKVTLNPAAGTGEQPGICPTGAQEIRWGNDSAEWVVELDGGIVVGGGVHGANYHTWTISGGYYDGDILYFQASTLDVEGCKSLLEAWWKVEATTVSSVKVRDGCGTESTEVHVFERR